MCTRRNTNDSDLTFESFKFILDKLNPLHVKFWGRGESLIHKDCWRMIDEMKKRDIIIYLTTNFNLDIDWQSISNVNVIYISLHTFNAKNYQKITGNKINKVLDNILKARSMKLNIAIKSVVQNINKDDVGEFIEIAEKYHIKYITTDVRNIGNPKEHDFQTCRQPNFPFIAVNGDIYPCCMTPIKIGNIFQDNIDHTIIDLAKARKLDKCLTCELN
jgi:molybdenum cofactor biosynthesis enzyme MoaA